MGIIKQKLQKWISLRKKKQNFTKQSTADTGLFKDTGKKFALGLNTISDPFDENRKPIFNIFGFTDISVVDFWAGFWTGIFGRDVRTEWHQCLGEPLKLVKDITDVSIEFMS